MLQTFRAARALVMVSGRELSRCLSPQRGLESMFEALEGRTLLSGVEFASAPAAPGGLVAVLASPGLVSLSWGATDRAAGFQVLRSVDGGAMVQIATIGSAAQLSLTDSQVQSNRLYQYEVRAFNGRGASAPSTRAQVLTPMLAASGVSVTLSASGALLAWTDNEPGNSTYLLMRSVNGADYRALTTLSGTATTFLDVSVVSGAAYSYTLIALSNRNASDKSTPASAALPIKTPIVTGEVGATSAKINWSGLDPATVSYVVMRSQDGGAFSTRAILNARARGFTETGLAPGTNYTYRVIATNASAPAALSSITLTTPLSVPPPINDGQDSVSITTRFDGELVITATGATDTIEVSQNGGVLTVSAGGQVLSKVAAPQSLFVHDRGGHTTITLAPSVTVRTTITGINGGFTTVTSGSANTSVWIDSSDAFSGQGVVHRVSGFAGGVSKAVGASLANPSDAGATNKVEAPLWSGAPVLDDVNQGGVGDCYFLATLAAFANEAPGVLLESAVDLGDGTYAVQYFEDGKPVYVRVSNELPKGYYSGGYQFAQPGDSGSIWVPIMEKAFAYFRDGSNTYASINAGWMGEVYRALNVSSADFWLGGTESAFYSMISLSLSSGKAVTLATGNAPPSLVGNHAYTLVSATMDSKGVTQYVVRNPWGISGASAESWEGYATLTFADMTKNFVMGTRAA